MLLSFLKIAFRNLFKNRVYSVINITGLSIGLAACLLVANVVIDDLSYDKQWKKVADIYRVSGTDESTGQKTPVVLSGLGPSLSKNFPEIENYCRVSKRTKQFIVNDKEKTDISCIISEPSFLSIFNFKFLQRSDLNGKPGFKSIILTKEIKDRYFGNTNPIGKSIKGILYSGNVDSIPYVVTGIVEGIPYNSHLRAEAIVLDNFSDEDNQLSSHGAGLFYSLYVLLKQAAKVENLEVKIDTLYKSIVKNELRTSFGLQPLRDIYLHSDFAEGYQSVIGSIRNVYIFSAVAVVLLLIACFNFINLTTVKSLKRLKETGVRKILGADKLQLVTQFLFESLIFFFISFILSMIFYKPFLKGVESYLGHKLTISFTQNISLFVAVIFVVFFVCVLVGLYPALLLAKTRMALALRGIASPKTGNSLVRKSLIVSQFTIAIIIIIAAMVAKKQLFFLNHADLGYDKNNLLVINNKSFGISGKSLKTELRKIAGVEEACLTSWDPGIGGGSMSMKVEDRLQKGKKIDLWFIEADLDFVSTLKLKLQQGRLLNNTIASDAPDIGGLYRNGKLDSVAEAYIHQSLLVSAYTAKVLNPFQLNTPSTSVPGIPVGIVNDFHNESLRTIMKPCIIKGNNNINYGNVLVRIRAGSGKSVIASIAKVWHSFYPSQTFDYSWAVDSLAAQYEAEMKTQQLFFFFSYISIFLACMGLFGLVSFTTEMRTKEIGIRKILGASATLISVMISKDFLKLVILSVFISVPAAVWLMHKWLEDYAYRVNISGWLLLAACLVTIVIALTTICFSSIKTALSNPVKSLRTE
jgi:putative ABC transport system permease protein